MAQWRKHILEIDLMDPTPNKWQAQSRKHHPWKKQLMYGMDWKMSNYEQCGLECGGEKWGARGLIYHAASPTARGDQARSCIREGLRKHGWLGLEQ